jgi:hypothetical protein
MEALCDECEDAIVCWGDDGDGSSGVGEGCAVAGYGDDGVPTLACSSDVTAPLPEPDPEPASPTSWCDSIPELCDQMPPDPLGGDPPLMVDHCVSTPPNVNLQENRTRTRRQCPTRR